MTNQTVDIVPAAPVKLDPPKLTTEQIQQLEALRTRIERARNARENAPGHKDIFAQTRRDLVQGKISEPLAVAVLVMERDFSSHRAIRDSLNKVWKEEADLAANEARELILAIRRDQTEQLRDKAASIEKRERADSKSIGLSDEDFEPSMRLRRVRRRFDLALDRQRKLEAAETIKSGDILDLLRD